MNKKIASEIAIGVILSVAIVVGVIFWAQTVKQETIDNSEKIETPQLVEKAGNDDEKTEDEQQNLTDESAEIACIARLFEGEASIRGSYVLDTIPGSTKKEWLFKVANEDIDKLPDPAIVESRKVSDTYLFIDDVTPELTAKLKKSTETELTIKGFYFDCEGVSVVSIEPARLALARYIKK
jgi:hypothetical protein